MNPSLRVLQSLKSIISEYKKLVELKNSSKKNKICFLNLLFMLVRKKKRDQKNYSPNQSNTSIYYSCLSIPKSKHNCSKNKT